MKNFVITVNGTSYDVQVEEVAAGTVSVAPKAAAPVVKPVVAAPAPVAPVAAAAPAPAAPAASAAGATPVNAPMPGKILSVVATPGSTVYQGDVILVLEAMKMENDIVAPADGTIATINVNVGDAVEAGAVLATMN